MVPWIPLMSPLAALFAAALTVASFAAQAQEPAALEQCHAIADAGGRLACYDRVSGHADRAPDTSPAEATVSTLGHSGGEQPSAAEPPSEGQPSILDAAWRLSANSDRYPISM